LIFYRHFLTPNQHRQTTACSIRVQQQKKSRQLHPTSTFVNARLTLTEICSKQTEILDRQDTRLISVDKNDLVDIEWKKNIKEQNLVTTLTHTHIHTHMHVTAAAIPKQ